ncbi:MAG: hypothetical protein MR992_00310 [Lachnospiraceae bacterium]|nr:hypothetical protein [Lachnospiraceae bacterium]MDD7627826.1 hypothetical protein [Lachnospiraceae bacterium]MDY4118784.1 hypothetical protein [Lachnospiraceae bacterium]
MRHDGCKGCAYENESITGKHCLYCDGTKQGDMYKRATNADRIRTMSDEELAMNMMCPNENGLGEIDCDKSDSCNCYECILHWLQSEVEE